MDNRVGLGPALTFVVVVCLMALPFNGSNMAGQVLDRSNDGQFISFSSGSGTASDPYQISNVTQLQNMSSNMSAHYVLVNDIDASETSGWNGGAGFEAIGHSSDRFYGTLDGQNHTIFGLVINTTAYYSGLFGYLGSGSIIENVRLENVRVRSGWKAGAIVAQNVGGIIRNCHVIGDVTGTSYIGGLVGDNGGTIEDCHVAVNVTREGIGQWIGGLVGVNGGTIRSCSATGSVSGGTDIGGLVGLGEIEGIVNSYYNIDATRINGENRVTPFGIFGDQFEDWIDNDLILDIDDHLALDNDGQFYEIDGLADLRAMLPFALREHRFRLTGDIDLAGEPGLYIPMFLGLEFDGAGSNISNLNISLPNRNLGFLGYLGNGARISNTTVRDAHVSGTWSIGGLVGINVDGLVDHCSAVDGVSKGESAVGGLVGSNTGGIERCHSNMTVDGQFMIGGLAGSNGGSVSDCQSNSTVSGTRSRVGGLVGNNDGTIVGSVSSGPVSGNENVGGLVGVIRGSATLENCTASGATSGSIKIGGLIGYLGGGAHVDYCSATGNVSGYDRGGGLIGYAYGGYTRNCHATGSVSVETGYAGGLVGKSDYGTVEDCFATGSASGDHSVGGLAGSISYRRLDDCHASGDAFGNINVGGLVGFAGNAVRNCSATGMVFGNDNVGGLVGESRSWIENSYALGNASGINNIGGLVGKNEGPGIKYCYSAGNASGSTSVGGLIGINGSNVEDCFWDIRSSGTNVSAGGTGKDGNEMRTRMTFTDAGWDFDTVWGIADGFSYPFFKDQYTDPVILTTIEDGLDATEDEPFSLTFSSEVARLPGCDDLPTYLVSTEGEWLSVDGSGLLSGTPSNGDVGVWWVNVTMADRTGPSDSIEFMVEVHNVNDFPVIGTDDIQSVPGYAHYYNDYDATDIDPTNDTLVWTIQTNATFLSLDSVTGELTGTPTKDHVGEWSVKVFVHDAHGGHDSTSFTLTVVYQNTDPVITTTSIPEAVEDEPYRAMIYGHDSDPTGDVLTWRLVSTNADFVEVDASTGELTGTPENDDVGEWWVEIEVSDGVGGVATVNLTLSVLNVNDEPEVLDPPIWYLVEEEIEDLDLTPYIQDVDNIDDLVLTCEAENITVNGFVLTAYYEDWVPEHNVTLTVSDGEVFVTEVLRINVINVNDLPAITAILPINGSEHKKGKTIVFSVNTTDVDGDELTITWKDGGTVLGHGSPFEYSKLGKGEHTITVVVYDGTSETEETLTIRVKEKKEESPGFGLVAIAVALAIATTISVVTRRG